MPGCFGVGVGEVLFCCVLGAGVLFIFVIIRVLLLLITRVVVRAIIRFLASGRLVIDSGFVLYIGFVIYSGWVFANGFVVPSRWVFASGLIFGRHLSLLVPAQVQDDRSAANHWPPLFEFPF